VREFFSNRNGRHLPTCHVLSPSAYAHGARSSPFTAANFIQHFTGKCLLRNRPQVDAESKKTSGMQ